MTDPIVLFENRIAHLEQQEYKVAMKLKEIRIKLAKTKRQYIEWQEERNV